MAHLPVQVPAAVRQSGLHGQLHRHGGQGGLPV